MILLAAAILPLSMAAEPKQYHLSSPDGDLGVTVEVGDRITWSLSHCGDIMIGESPVSLSLEDGSSYGIAPGRAACRTVSADRIITSSLYKKAEISGNSA